MNYFATLAVSRTDDEPDYTGIDFTHEAEDVPIFSTSGHVVARIAGKVKLDGEACASWRISDLHIFDEDGIERRLQPPHPADTGIDAICYRALAADADRVAPARLHDLYRFDE